VLLTATDDANLVATMLAHGVSTVVTMKVAASPVSSDM
jgi:hypothetical protein